MNDARVERVEGTRLADAAALLHDVGWTFAAADLERLARMGPAWGALDAKDALVGFLSCVDHGDVRWIGNVVVAEDARGQGLGARLVRAASEGARAVGLHSVEAAVTLYERLGFKATGEAFALRATLAQPHEAGRAAPMRAADLADVVRLDRASTGMDRRGMLHELLRAFPETWRVVRQGGELTGYGLAKVYDDGTELGPVLAATPQAVTALLDELLASTPGPHEAMVLGENDKAADALMDRGFERAFRAVTMFRGEPPAWKPHRLVVAAAPEKG